MNMCRTCLEIPADKDISQLENGINEDNKNYIGIMEFCLDIKVTQNSKITTKLCNNCYRQIIMFYKFKTLSLMNDVYLQSLDPAVSVAEQKLSVYVDENGIKHENFLDTDEYGPSLVEDDNTDIKVKIQMKNEVTLDDGSDQELQSDVNSVKNENMKHETGQNDADNKKKYTQEYENVAKETRENGKKKQISKPKKRGRPGRPKKVKLCDAGNVTQERQVCEECGMSVLDLKTHSLRHQPKDNRQMLQCTACPRMFFTNGGRRRHYRTAHLGQKSKCDVCNKEVIYLSVHKLKMHNQDAAPFGCVSCERRCVSQSALDQHMITHTKDRAFECDICHKKFRSKGFVSRHIRQVHEKEKNHKCEICSKGFFDKILLQEHLRTHTTERLFTCTDCNKSFTTKTTLRKHRYLHSDVRKYSCDVCNKSFKVHRYLKSHMFSHTKEKAYPCQYCGARFGRADNRRVHELKHQKQNG